MDYEAAIWPAQLLCERGRALIKTKIGRSINDFVTGLQKTHLTWFLFTSNWFYALFLPTRICLHQLLSMDRFPSHVFPYCVSYTVLLSVYSTTSVSRLLSWLNDPSSVSHNELSPGFSWEFFLTRCAGLKTEAVVTVWCCVCKNGL